MSKQLVLFQGVLDMPILKAGSLGLLQQQDETARRHCMGAVILGALSVQPERI